MDEKNEAGVMVGPILPTTSIQAADTGHDFPKKPMEFKYKTKFLRRVKAKPLKLGINNNAILMFERIPAIAEKDNTFKITVINQEGAENADKDKYEYIEDIVDQRLDNTNSFQIRLMNQLGCFKEIRKLMNNLKLDRLILVRHGISVHSLLDTGDKVDFSENVLLQNWTVPEAIRNSKLLPTQMLMDGPIFKQAHKLWLQLDGNLEHDEQITFNITHFCSDLIRTQQSLMTFKCAYDYYKLHEKGSILTPIKSVIRETPYYDLYIDCIKTSTNPQMREFYDYMSEQQEHKNHNIFYKQLEYFNKLP